MSLNKTILIGRIGQDPKRSFTTSNQSVANFTMATDESYKDASGNKIGKSEWHKIVAWGKQADFVAEYLTKGRLVLVEGKLQTRKWQDKDGQDRYTTEIVAQRVAPLDKKPESHHPQAEAPLGPWGEVFDAQPVPSGGGAPF